MVVTSAYTHTVFDENICEVDQELGSGEFTGGGGGLGLIFAGYVLLASQSPYPITVYSVANYRPHLSHFWANM